MQLAPQDDLEILIYLEDADVAVGNTALMLHTVCVQALKAAGDTRAEPLLAEAYQMLQTAAAEMPDEAARNRFLEEIPWHKELAALWAATGS